MISLFRVTYIIGSLSMGNIKVESILPHHFIDVNCSGSELSISDCPHNGLMHYTCPSSHDAAIACFKGKIINIIFSLYLF